MSKTFLSLWVCVANLVAVGALCPAQSSEKSTNSDAHEREILVTRTLELGAGPNDSIRREVDIGGFPPGSLLDCKVSVRNAEDRTVRFDRVEAGCACLSITPQRGEIAPGGELVFEAKLRVVKRPLRLVHTATFSCYDGQLPSLSIRLGYKLIGVIGFTARDAEVRIPNGSGTYRAVFPIFADGVEIESLLEYGFVQDSEETNSIRVSLDMKSKALVLEIPESVVSDRSLSTELFIENIETGFSGTLLVGISKQSAISIFPTKLRFSLQEPTPTSDARVFVAPAMVLDRNHPGDVATPAQMTASIEGKRLRVEAVRHGGKLTHFKIYLPSKPLDVSSEVSELSCRCEIVGHKTKAVVFVPVSKSVLSFMPTE